GISRSLQRNVLPAAHGDCGVLSFDYGKTPFAQTHGRHHLRHNDRCHRHDSHQHLCAQRYARQQILYGCALPPCTATHRGHSVGGVFSAGGVVAADVGGDEGGGGGIRMKRKLISFTLLLLSFEIFLGREEQI